MSGPDSQLFLAREVDIQPSCSVKFAFLLKEKKLEGFLINDGGNFRAYINRCRHMGITLDWDTGEFYNRQKDGLICKTHGAVYRPDTGACTSGPCLGKSLFPLPLLRESGEVFLDVRKSIELYSD